MPKPTLNIISNYGTIEGVIEMLQRVEDKSLPLIFRAKFLKSVDLTEDYIDLAQPNESIEIYNNSAVLTVLPIGPFKHKKGKK